VLRCLNEAGIGFMFAPRFHPAMRFAGPVRREIGIRTIFNVLGPLTNPARVQHQVLGVPSPALAEKLAAAMSRMPITRGMVVHGAEGLDELSLEGANLVFEVRGGHPPERHTLEAASLGLQPAPITALRGGDAAENAAIARAVLSGEEHGPRRDVVLLNAAAALLAGNAAPDMAAGLEMARASIDEGRAMERLQTLVRVSQSAAH
jgi:anthranilate phosphoribosyltransferase